MTKTEDEKSWRNKLISLLAQHEHDTRIFVGSVKELIHEVSQKPDPSRFDDDRTPTVAISTHLAPPELPSDVISESLVPPTATMPTNCKTEEKLPKDLVNEHLENENVVQLPNSIPQVLPERQQSTSPNHPDQLFTSRRASEISAQQDPRTVTRSKQSLDEADSDSSEVSKAKPRTAWSSNTNDQWNQKKTGTPNENRMKRSVTNALGTKTTSNSKKRIVATHEPEDAIQASINAFAIGDIVDFSAKQRQAIAEAFILVAIVSNAVFVGWRVQDQAVNGKASLMGVVGECCFCFIFTMDIIFRLANEGCRPFFLGHEKSWNIFDSVIVLTQIVDMVLGFAFEITSSTFSSMSAMRLLRLLRLLRVIRVIQLLKSMREFRLLVFSIARAWRGCVAVLTIIILLLYCFGILFTEATFEYCRQDGNKDDALCTTFGKLDLSMRSLYESMLGGVLWGEVLDVLQPLNVFYSFVFIAFISFSIIIFLNMVASVFGELEHETATKERQHTAIDDEIRDVKLTIRKLNHLFQEFDANMSGDVSYDQFAEGLKNPDVVGLLGALKLDVFDSPGLFNLLDADGNGVIERKEFVYGCMRLRGDAKNKDMQQLKADVDTIVHAMEVLEDHFGSLVRWCGEDLAHHWSADRGDDGKKTQLSNSIINNDTSTLKGKKKKTTNRAQGRIDKAEDRAMLLREIKGVGKKIMSECATELWQDMRTGSLLEPSEVNLYNFNYHYILPNSLLGPITLSGLDNITMYKGSKIVLSRVDNSVSEALPLAVGFVEEVLGNGVVSVMTLRGRFRHEENCSILVGHDSVDTGLVRFGKPQTCSYKELISQHACTAEWYCCHWWGEKIFEFVECVDHHARSRNLGPNSSYWVCGYANRQHELDLDIGGDLEATSFFVTMRKVQGVLLILDNDATPFGRIWCDFEIYSSMSNACIRLDMITIDVAGSPQLISEGLLPNETSYQKVLREQCFPQRILLQGIRLRLQDGESTVAADKERILQSMAGTVPSDPNYANALGVAVRQANTALHAVFAIAAWPMALKCGSVQNFDDGLSLVDVLKSDVSRQQLKLNLSHISDLYDSDISNVVEGFTEGLQELDLSFEGSPHITDDGLIDIANHIPRHLRTLLLDFSSCKEISDRGIEELAMSLPATLVHLELDFANCPLVSATGIKELAKQVPDTLTQFKGSFRGTEANIFFTTLDKIKQFGSAKASLLNKMSNFSGRVSIRNIE